MTPPDKSDWLKPSTILTLAGMLASIALAWANLDRRVTGVESRAQNNAEAIQDGRRETREDLRDIQQKLDRLIEKGAK